MEDDSVGRVFVDETWDRILRGFDAGGGRDGGETNGAATAQEEVHGV